jgi:putative aldouronate transport system substrate-binding protein
MNKRKFQFLGKTFAGIMAFSLLLTACGKGNDEGKTTGSSDSTNTSLLSSASEEGTNTSVSKEEQVEADREMVDISWMSVLHTDSPPSDEVIDAINKFANVNLTFQWVPAATVDERMNAALAGGDMADIVTMNRLTNATQRAALGSGIFWDVESYLKDYPHLAETSQGRLDSVKVNGMLSGVPIVKPVARYGLVIRQDWLDKLGLEVPHTVEELEKVAMAFVNDDPDGNGQNDTYALIERNESWNVSFRQVAGWYGAPNKWGLTEEGKVEPWFLHDGYYEAMELYKKFYEAGVINSDFAVMEKNDQKQAAAQGKGGIVITGLYDARNYYNLAVELGLEGEMEWALINDMHVDGGEIRSLSDTNNGVGGVYAMPKSEVKDEAALKRILQFLDDMSSKEGFLLMTNGIEGVHYKMEGNTVINLDQEKWKQEVQALSGSRINELVTYEFDNDNPMVQESNKMILANEEHAVYDVSPPLQSKTYDTLYSQIEKLPKDAFYNYVMDEISMDDVKAEHQKWLDQGGQQMIDEFTASYKELNG